MRTLSTVSTPQLRTIHSGKVRESLRVNEATRLIVATDRLSAFDRVLKTPIPAKGAVLNSLSSYWFEKTRHIIENHMLRQLAINAMLVKEVFPIRIEMVVRGYLSGSVWRRYANGERCFSGAVVADRMQRNERFPVPLLTPTTKEKKDREITPQEIIGEGWVAQETYEQMEQASLQLFQCGTDVLAEKGLILVDTKYEFGLLDGKLILIDELHTPDSSRFWSADNYAEDPETVSPWDKEYVRAWLLEQEKEGERPDQLSDEIVEETSKRYRAIYEKITDEPLPAAAGDPGGTLYQRLVDEAMIKDGYVAVVMGSPSDLVFSQRIAQYLADYDVAVDMRVASAHKTPEAVQTIAQEYNDSLEPGAIIAVAGLSNGLGGALAANTTLPVFNCPPFKDASDMALNINSSLMLPSMTPASTVIRPENASLAALRSLNLRRLRERFASDILETKASLAEEDQRVRGREDEC